MVVKGLVCGSPIPNVVKTSMGHGTLGVVYTVMLRSSMCVASLMSVNFEAGAQPDGLIILNLTILGDDSIDVKSSHLKTCT